MKVGVGSNDRLKLKIIKYDKHLLVLYQWMLLSVVRNSSGKTLIIHH